VIGRSMQRCSLLLRQRLRFVNTTVMCPSPQVTTMSQDAQVAEKRRLPEPLLDVNPDRFCMFPIKHHDIWNMYKQAEASFWTGARHAPDRRSTPAHC
jgi:hypothetical protein